MPANLISVPSLHSELLQSTALTPTYHKSRGLQIGISFIVGLAVPVVGKGLADAFEISSAIGVAFTTAAVGAAAGAGVAYAGGGDPLLGAFAGGAGGFISGGGLGAVFGEGLGTVGDFGGQDVPMPGGGGPEFLGAAQTYQPAIPTTVAAPVTTIAAPITTGAVQPQIGAGLDAAFDFDNFIDFSGGEGFAADTSSGLQIASRPGAPQPSVQQQGYDPFAGMPDPRPEEAGTIIYRGDSVTPGGGSGGGGAPAPLPAEEPWYSDLLPSKKDIAGGVKDLMVMGLTEAGQEPPPQTQEETVLQKGRDEALEEQLRLQGKKEAISDQFMARARTISPLQRGQEQFALAKQKHAKLAREQERRLAPDQTGALAAFRRRVQLNESRLGSEFRGGYQSGQLDVQRLMTQGLAALPTGSPMYTSASGALDAAKRGYARQYQEDQNRATWLSGIMGNSGVLSAEERKRRADELRAKGLG